MVQAEACLLMALRLVRGRVDQADVAEERLIDAKSAAEAALDDLNRSLDLAEECSRRLAVLGQGGT